MIQIFGSGQDPHITSVLTHLKKMGEGYNVLDIYDVRSDGFSADLPGNISFAFAEGEGSIEETHAVWWRIKPPFFVDTSSVVDYYDQQFASREWGAALEHFSQTLSNTFWMNDRCKAKAASDKIYQLKLASQLGMKIPKSLLTNNPLVALEFLDGLDPKKCLFKTLTPYISPDRKQKFASVVGKNELVSNSEAIKTSPILLQEYIKRDYELRITVVGEEIFSVKISPKSPDLPDWRREIWEDIYDIIEPPKPLIDRLLKFHRLTGLVFGAYDFIFCEDGNYYFIEVNPSGQWLWLEDKLELPISNCVARCLTNF